ncbi:MAG: Rrf2 family transcriptional regulator [Bacteroidetes bacterium]|nr:Rrf2 family transcriptional regulator [Bacteroidota bacterium]MCH8233907.1 Rrf2 family transcriptional regulator [Bacteroidota bacterium]
MISNKCKYALRAILFLAVESNETKKIRISELAEELKMPTPYLGKILQELVPKSIISSIKGPRGGFYLTEKNQQAPLIKIIEAIDGLAYFEKCGLGLEDCSDSHPCPIHEDFKKSRDHLKTVFTNKTIRELASEIIANELILVS